jgi:hypothetical protein
LLYCCPRTCPSRVKYQSKVREVYGSRPPVVEPMRPGEALVPAQLHEAVRGIGEVVVQSILLRDPDGGDEMVTPKNRIGTRVYRLRDVAAQRHLYLPVGAVVEVGETNVVHARARVLRHEDAMTDQNTCCVVLIIINGFSKFMSDQQPSSSIRALRYMAEYRKIAQIQ